MAKGERGAVLVEVAGGRVHTLALMCTIGRHATSLLVLDDPSVSSHHAEVVRTAHGRYLLRDLCTRGGTLVGGQRVVERFLVDGDVIAIGQVRLRFEERSRPARPRRRAIDVSSPPPA